MTKIGHVFTGTASIFASTMFYRVVTGFRTVRQVFDPDSNGNYWVFFLTNGKKKIKGNEIKWVRLMAGPQRQRATGFYWFYFFLNCFFFKKKRCLGWGMGKKNSVILGSFFLSFSSKK